MDVLNLGGPMTTKGLFMPLSVIQGDTLDVTFDISLDGSLLSDTEILLDGYFGIEHSTDDILNFEFLVDEITPTKHHAIINSSLTSELDVGEYTYQIRIEHLTDINGVNSIGYRNTILYGSLVVLHSPMPY